MSKLFRECIQCGHAFYLTEADQQFFAERELTLPRRCWTCRQKNRKEQEAALGKAESSSDEFGDVWQERRPSPRKPGRSPVRPQERRVDRRLSRSRG